MFRAPSSCLRQVTRAWGLRRVPRAPDLRFRWGWICAFRLPPQLACRLSSSDTPRGRASSVAAPIWHPGELRIPDAGRWVRTRSGAGPAQAARDRVVRARSPSLALPGRL